MDKTRRANIAKAVGILAEAWRQRITDTTIDSYFIGLEGIPIEQVMTGVHKAIQNCKFMPSCAELRDMCGVMSLEHRADMAWNALCKAVKKHGYYDTVDFDDKAINACIRSRGGWMAIYDLTEDEFDVWFRKEFLRQYQNLCRYGVSREQAAPLLGFHQRNNSARGFHVDKRGDQLPFHPTEIVTGLPLLPNCTPGTQEQIEAEGNYPRIELKRPPEPDDDDKEKS